MSIEFSLLAPHIQLQVVEKAGWKDFLRFQKASRYSKTISNNLKKKITFNVEDINLLEIEGKLAIKIQRNRHICREPSESPFRFHAYTLRFVSELTDNLLSQLVPLLRAKRIVAVGLDPLPAPPVWSGENFNLLLEASSIHSLHGHHRLPVEFVKVPAFGQISNFDCRCAITDTELLSLKSAFMWIFGTHVTSEGMNRYLKEYIAGKREIKEQSIRSSRPFQSSLVLEGIPHFKVETAAIDDGPEEVYEITDESGKSVLRVAFENRTINIQSYIVTPCNYSDSEDE